MHWRRRWWKRKRDGGEVKQKKDQAMGEETSQVEAKTKAPKILGQESRRPGSEGGASCVRLEVGRIRCCPVECRLKAARALGAAVLTFRGCPRPRGARPYHLASLSLRGRRQLGYQEGALATNSNNQNHKPNIISWLF